MPATDQGDTGLAMLIFRDEFADRDTFERADPKALFQRFLDWSAELDRRGKYVAANPLASGGKTVRRRGAATVIDGPYAEGREAVLGYVIVRVASLDEAVSLAQESPHTQVGGTTEVRELRAFPQPGQRA